MTKNEKVVIVLSFFVFLVGFFYAFGNLFWASWVSKDANFELVRFYKEIEVGWTLKSAEEAFHRGKFEFLIFSSDNNVIYIKTPFKFGSSNWVSTMRLENGSVIWKKIRTEDDPKTTPEGAPKDEP